MKKIHLLILMAWLGVVLAEQNFIFAASLQDEILSPIEKREEIQTRMNAIAASWDAGTYKGSYDQAQAEIIALHSQCVALAQQAAVSSLVVTAPPGYVGGVNILSAATSAVPIAHPIPDEGAKPEETETAQAEVTQESPSPAVSD